MKQVIQYLLALCAMWCAAPGHAQYPARPITLLVPN